MPTRKKPVASADKPRTTRRSQRPAHAGGRAVTMATKPPISASARPRAALPGATKHHLPIGRVSSRAFGRLAVWPVRLAWERKWLLVYLAVIGATVLAVVSEGVRQSTDNLRYDGNSVQMSNVPKRDVALVFGAGVLPDHTPTEYLKNRVATAVQLYKAGRVSTIVVSGDNSSSHYDEPTVMKRYALTLGARSEDVVLDYAGYNTYDTCYRARAIFQIRSAIVVTQGYHLPRAVMTCQRLGIDTIGVSAEHLHRDWTVAYVVREHLSTAKAAVQLFVRPQPTVLGNAEPLGR